MHTLGGPRDSPLTPPTRPARAAGVQTATPPSSRHAHILSPGSGPSGQRVVRPCRVSGVAREVAPPAGAGGRRAGARGRLPPGRCVLHAARRSPGGVSLVTKCLAGQVFHGKPVMLDEHGGAVQQAGRENGSLMAAQTQAVTLGSPCALSQTRRPEPRNCRAPRRSWETISKESDLFVLRECFTILPDGV